MANLQPKIQIERIKDVDTFDTMIDVIVFVDGEETHFNINRDEFETFCDTHELRDFENNIWNHRLEDFDTESGTTPWATIYEGREKLTELLKGYIENVHAMDAMDIQTPIKKILSSHKAAI